MTLTQDEYVAAVAGHSAGFAAVIRGAVDSDGLEAALARPVEHCPGWSVADLLDHLTGVQWFWATVVDERRPEPPADAERPVRAPDPQLLDRFTTGAARLVSVLQAADPAQACWSWAPSQQDAAFTIRHQAQEAAVHHWDAAHAVGAGMSIDPAAAADAVEEFLTFSVASTAYPAPEGAGPLGEPLAVRATDHTAGWTIRDGSVPGTLEFSTDLPEGVAAIEASASDLLLWLYGRVAVDTSAVDLALVERFRALCYTD